jgi:hypothetical protein
MDWHGFLWSWLVQRAWEAGVLGGGSTLVDWVLVRLVRNAVSEAKVGGLVGVSLLFRRKGLLGLIGCSLGLWIPCSVDSSLFVSLAVEIGLLGGLVFESSRFALVLLVCLVGIAFSSGLLALFSWVFLGLVLPAWFGPSSLCPLLWFLSCSSVSLRFRLRSSSLVLLGCSFGLSSFGMLWLA